MFSGKTEALLRVLKRTRPAELPTQFFVPSTDTRNGVGVVVSHGGLDLESLGLTAWAVDPAKPVGLANRVRKGTKVVALDEAQFFSDELLPEIEELLFRGLLVYVAGLDKDYTGAPFGPLPQLLAMADYPIKLTAICKICKQDTARYSFRLKDSPQLVLLGNEGEYAPMCRECYGAATRRG